MEWRELPSPYHDPKLWLEGLARCEADILAERDVPLVGRVRAHVATRLEAGHIAMIADTAQALGLSSRSLVRTLSHAGLTHHLIVDEDRRARARVLLSQPGLALAEIAERLHFPDQSSFGRKCQTWFGTSPARFRRQLLSPVQPPLRDLA